MWTTAGCTCTGEVQVHATGRGPFQFGAQKNSSALAATLNRLRPNVVFEYSSPQLWNLTQQQRCMGGNFAPSVLEEGKPLLTCPCAIPVS